MITPEPANINEILFRAQGRLRLTLGARVGLHIEPDPDLENALLDKSQIEQLLLNLALNAREAMPEGGRVTISTRSAKAASEAARHADAAGIATATSSAIALSAASIANVGEIPPGPAGDKPEAERKAYITLTFKDDGKGMDAETAAHVFDPFFSTKRTISVTSVPGTGTEFVIHLPVFAEAKHSHNDAFWKKGPDVPAGTESARKKTILLVEDEIAVRKLASEVLRASGYQILTLLSSSCPDIPMIPYPRWERSIRCAPSCPNPFRLRNCWRRWARCFPPKSRPQGVKPLLPGGMP